MDKEKIKHFYWAFLGAFLLLLCLSFSFGYHLLPELSSVFGTWFESWAAFTGKSIIAWSNYTHEISSDSRSFLANGINIVFLSIVLAALSSHFLSSKLDVKKIKYWCTTAIAYYLAIQLLSYGFNKVFKWQFFIPEPNTLYTPLGQLNKDILYWSSMGSSYTYTVFAGVLEVLAAILLLFKSTRFLGALMSFGILFNVFMINVGFNISVKMYSAILMGYSWALLMPKMKALVDLSKGKTVVYGENWKPNYGNKKWLYYATKTIIVLMLFMEGLWPYLNSGNYNDDKAERPPLHGAYEVSHFFVNDQELMPSIEDGVRWRRFFVHRRGYFIVQNMQDDMVDYQLLIDTNKQLLELKDYHDQKFHFSYQTVNDTLKLQGAFGNNQIQIHAVPLDWKSLPLIAPEFHWTVDEINPNQ